MNQLEASTRDATVDQARWPKVIGTIGIVLGVLMILDQLGDITFPLFWPEDYLTKILEPEAAEDPAPPDQ